MKYLKFLVVCKELAVICLFKLCKVYNQHI